MSGRERFEEVGVAGHHGGFGGDADPEPSIAEQGFVIVPKKPTQNMCVEGLAALSTRQPIRLIYRRMIAARPTQDGAK